MNPTATTLGCFACPCMLCCIQIEMQARSHPLLVETKANFDPDKCHNGQVFGAKSKMQFSLRL